MSVAHNRRLVRCYLVDLDLLRAFTVSRQSINVSTGMEWNLNITASQRKQPGLVFLMLSFHASDERYVSQLLHLGVWLPSQIFLAVYAQSRPVESAEASVTRRSRALY